MINPDNPEQMGDAIPPRKPASKEPKQRTSSVLSMVRTVILWAVVLATVFTFWNPHSLFTTQASVAFLPTPANAANGSTGNRAIHVGIQAGHYKHNEGYTCPDGIKEVDIDYVVANKVSLLLGASQILVDVLNEYDLNLINYKGDALVSVHTRSCTDAQAAVSGFTLGTSISAKETDKTNGLATCLAEQYNQNTGLTFNYQVIPDNQVNSHTFLDINQQTPAVLIETGSLAVDRAILIEGSDRAANGITAGILCYLKSQGLIK
jgi:N-acetylmuramoyl-L-alanine amidase